MRDEMCVLALEKAATAADNETMKSCALQFYIALGSGLLAACSGQSGGEAPGPDLGAELAGPQDCEVVGRRTLALDQDAPIGFSGNDMLDLAAGEFTVALAYADATHTTLMLRLDHTADQASYLDRQAAPGTASSDCAPELRVPVRLELSTSDGQFAESFDGQLRATQAVTSGLFIEQPVEQLRGSFDYQRFDAAEYAARSVIFDLLFNRDGVEGRLQGRGQNPDQDDRITDIGRWPDSGDSQ